MKISLINNKIGSKKVRSKSCAMKSTIKTNNRSHNLSELNIIKIKLD